MVQKKAASMGYLRAALWVNSSVAAMAVSMAWQMADETVEMLDAYLVAEMAGLMVGYWDS